MDTLRLAFECPETHLPVSFLTNAILNFEIQRMEYKEYNDLLGNCRKVTNMPKPVLVTEKQYKENQSGIKCF